MPRRRWLTTALTALGAVGLGWSGPGAAAPPKLRLPDDDTPTQTFDFETLGEARAGRP